MAEIALKDVRKTYGTVEAIKGVSLDIDDGEFVVLVGPSGCGKSTLLRMIAGLEGITGGDILIGGRQVNNVEPAERDIAMVFQNYALYPHMTVRQNLAYGLKNRQTPAVEIDRRIAAAAKTLEIEPYLDRKPRQLSGGQRQRVAMGRAIVRKPAAFLMDEPLSNLDAKLRVQMRGEIASLQRKLNVTTIYVTHDQVEAMTMGDRVAVMKGGVLQQVDTPQNLYNRPENVFVAAFIGSPSMNLYEAVLNGRTLTLGSNSFEIPDRVFEYRPSLNGASNRQVIVGFRPEHMNDAAIRPSSAEISAPVTLVEALGSESLVHLNIDAAWVDAGDPDAVADIGDERAAVARFSPKSTVRAGDIARIAVDAEELHFFEPDTRTSIW